MIVNILLVVIHNFFDKKFKCDQINEQTLVYSSCDYSFINPHFTAKLHYTVTYLVNI